MSKSFERWIFTQEELQQNGEGCKGDDEFIAHVEGPNGDEHDVIVLRNGQTTNRWADGTVGLPVDIRELADGMDTCGTTNGEIATEWRNVAVEDNMLVKILN